MKKINKILVASLAVLVLCGTSLCANAASSNVNIEIKATAMDNVSVTVPTTLPIVFNEDGTNTLPTNWTIENKSTIAGIHLSQVEMHSSDAKWQLLSHTEDTKTLPVGTKAMQFSIGKAGALKMVEPTQGRTSAAGSVGFEANEISIPSGENQVLSFAVERGAFASAEASAKAFDMVLTFNFN